MGSEALRVKTLPFPHFTMGVCFSGLAFYVTCPASHTRCNVQFEAYPEHGLAPRDLMLYALLQTVGSTYTIGLFQVT